MATPPTRFLVRLTGQQALMLKFFQDNSKISIDLRRNGDLSRIGDFWFSMGKKINSIDQYKEDVPEATTTVTLESKTLTDPTEDAVPVKTKPVNASIKEKEATDQEVTLMRDKQNQHKVKINDNGTNREVVTNEKFTTKEEYKTKIPAKKEGEEAKKDGDPKDTEKKDSEEKKPAQQ